MHQQGHGERCHHQEDRANRSESRYICILSLKKMVVIRLLMNSHDKENDSKASTDAHEFVTDMVVDELWF